MRTPARYPSPGYADANDKRLVQVIRPADSPQRGAVNVLGVPFDGAVLGRRGAAGGPAGVRESMLGFSTYSSELGASLEDARVFDLGDVEVDRGDALKAHPAIESEVSGALIDDSVLVLLGGDNSISLPSLRACAKKYQKLGLVVVDSHLDLRGEIGGRPTSGSSYGLAMEQLKGLDPRRVVEIGSHGFLNSRFYHEEAERLGVTTITARSMRGRGTETTAERAYEIASDGADMVYVSIDLDAADLAYVSGVSAPSVGGMSGSELCSLAYTLGKKDGVRCADLVELAPSLDPTGMSQRVAAAVLVHLIAGFSSSKPSQD